MKYIFFYLTTILTMSLCGQNTPPNLSTGDPDFDKEIRELLNFSVPSMSTSELSLNIEDVTILDAREHKEYHVSHIPNAQCIGYQHWDKKLAKSLDKTKPIVVYCSVGYRSEKIAEKLEKMGYTVYNLYGSIFQWANEGRPLITESGDTTTELHTYNKNWSRWVSNPEITKIF